MIPGRFRIPRCSANCPPCADARRRAVRRAVVMVVLYTAGAALIGAGFPADGLLGIGLTAAGVVLTWFGYWAHRRFSAAVARSEQVAAYGRGLDSRWHR